MKNENTVIVNCDHCGGTGEEPGMPIDNDGLVALCSVCWGSRSKIIHKTNDPVVLVVVRGGVAEVHARNANVKVVDIDNIKGGDELVELNKEKFGELVEEAGIQEHVTWEK
jgi:hypothetical protein